MASSEPDLPNCKRRMTAAPRPVDEPCKRCGGTGKVRALRAQGKPWAEDVERICLACDGQPVAKAVRP